MPDLPRVLTDAPDADDLQHGQRTRPHHAGGLRRRLPAALLAGALAVTLAGGLLVSNARADDLTDQRDALKQQISRTKSDLNESSAALSTAGVKVDETSSRLAAARAEQSRAESALAAARGEDARLATKLKKAQADLAKARAAVTECQERLAAKKQMVGVMVRSAYQQQTNLMPVAMLTAPTTADLATRMQWATTMFDTTQSKIDELLALESQLKAKRAQLADAEAKVAKDRADAADALAQTRRLEAQARVAATTVAGELAQRQAIEEAASKDVAQDKAQYVRLTAERSTVEHRIAVRIAKEQAAARAAKEKAAAAAAKTAKERAARQEAQARAEQRAAAKVKHATPRHSAPRRTAPARASRSVARVAVPQAPRQASSPASTSSSGAHHGFIYPVSAPITSPYGMRFHPVLHVWKLHDGTDFGAGCGTAIHAAYDGVVAEKYFNAGYGNRLMIDHGKVDGKYVTTGYNHAISYVVGVGQHVKQGQVIGYVGTTGFSTGCHLHLMVWLNGGMVNPMTWY